MNKLKYALIGCGRIAPNHAEAVIQNLDMLEPVALCDIVPDRMEEILRNHWASCIEGVACYSSYQEMLSSDRRPDLVAIATESGKHAEIAMDCLRAGCHVIVEKPIALSIEDARRMIALAEEKGLVLCACHQNRFNRSIRKIREAMEDGRFGRLLHGTAHIRWNRGPSYYEQASWRGTWEQDGGALMNQCIHNIDLLAWMMGGDIDEVFAYTDNLAHPYISGEDLGIAILRFRNGAYGMIEGTTSVFASNLEETVYLFGETGTVKAGGKSVNVIEEWRFADQMDDAEGVKAEYRENPPNVYGYGHNPLYRDVIDAIVNHRSPLVDGRQGLRALELVLAIYKSSKEGKPVKLPLDSFSTMDMKGSFRHDG